MVSPAEAAGAAFFGDGQYGKSFGSDLRHFGSQDIGCPGETIGLR